jgi:hypothetical protein
LKTDWRANKRRKVTAATRARMSAAQRARVASGAFHYPTGRPWKKWEDELVRKLPAAIAAKHTRRSLSSVYSRRGVLHVPDARKAGNAAFVIRPEGRATPVG